jgi:TolB-like protein
LISFDAFQLDLSSGELFSETGRIRLQHQPFQILVALVVNPGVVVTRDEIRRQLWPGETTVEFGHGIDTAVKKLRRALGDDAAHPRYIETLPRRGYRWLTVVTWDERNEVPVQTAVRNREEAIDSIAVLPFNSLSADSESDYFSEGLAEEILNALTGVAGLKVTARTSSFAFRGKHQDIRGIGEALGVRAILEGSVRRAGNRLRMTVQLISTSDGCHLWSEQYDRELTDVFAVQEEISRAIVNRLNGNALTTRAVRQTANVESYDAYLKGRHCFSGVTPDTAIRAAAFFEEAISLDPDYAPAYSGLARCFFVFVQFGMKPAMEMMPQVRAAALRAVHLNEMDSEAQAILGQVAGAFDYDWTEALRRCRLALACEPVTHMAQHWCAQFILVPLRRLDEAIALLETLLIADPFALFPRKTLADALAMRGDNDRSIAELRRLLELDGRFWLAWGALGGAYANQDKFPEAIKAYEKAQQSASYPVLPGHLAAAYHRVGERGRAQCILDQLDPLNERGNYAQARMFYHFWCLEFDRGADYLEELISMRHPDVIWVCFSLPQCREYPRVRALIEKIFSLQET